MRNFEFWILAYLLNSSWQVPLLFGAGWLAARALRSVSPAAEHRVWDNWPFFLLFTALMTLEWWLRKRHGWV